MEKELRITEAEYREILKKAEESGACKKELDLLKELSLKEALKHEKLQEWIRWYVYRVIGGRWPEAEEIIRKDPWYAYCYARYVIKGRWREAESIIGKDAESAYFYSTYVIKGRWPAAEDTIRKYEHYWILYKIQFKIKK